MLPPRSPYSIRLHASNLRYERPPNKLIRNILSNFSRAASTGCEVRVHWIPGHSDIAGNLLADDLARRARLNASEPSECLLVSRAFLANCLSDILRRQRSRSWSKCLQRLGRTVNFFFANYGNFEDLYRLEPSVPLLAGMQGHNFCPFSSFLYGKIQSPSCPLCGSQEEANALHFVTQCNDRRIVELRKKLRRPPTKDTFGNDLRERCYFERWRNLIVEITHMVEPTRRSLW